jgi:hypothetical protein
MLPNINFSPGPDEARERLQDDNDAGTYYLMALAYRGKGMGRCGTDEITPDGRCGTDDAGRATNFWPRISDLRKRMHFVREKRDKPPAGAFMRDVCG